MKRNRTLLTVFSIVVIIGLSCRKELPFNASDFLPIPILQGSISSDHGVHLTLTRSLDPSKDLQEIFISDASIIVISEHGDTFPVPEVESGIYQDQEVPIDSTVMYRVITSHPDFETVSTDWIEFAILPLKTEVSYSFDPDDKVLSFTLKVRHLTMYDSWFWVRFSGSTQPRYTNLANEQDYTLCQADNVTGSASMIASSSCSVDSLLSIAFHSYFHRSDTVPDRLTLEVVHLNEEYVEYLRSQEIFSYEFFFDEPVPPPNNTSVGFGYVGTENVEKFTLALE